MKHIPLCYRVTGQNGNNLLLTYFRQLLQLLDHYCGSPLPRQNGVTSQI